jgi:multidrug efflux system membrane fusion protein
MPASTPAPARREAAAWGAAPRQAAPPVARAEGSGEMAVLSPHQAARVFDAVRRVALQPDLPGADRVLRCGIAELTASERVYCLFRDQTTGALWSLDDELARRSADQPGVTTFAARSGAALACPRAADAPLYRIELDDPHGDGSERMMVQPVEAAGPIVAVIAAFRHRSAPSFTPLERAALCAFASQCGPILQHFALDHQLRSAAAAPSGQDGMVLFRPEALALRAVGVEPGDLLRFSPAWIRWSYRFLIAAALAGIAFASLSTVRRYSAGPAVVQLSGAAITAADNATVAAVRVAPGARVQAGDLLVELHDQTQVDELRGLAVEMDDHVAGFLLDPTDQPTRRGLADLAARMDEARTRAAERSARAPRDGVVTEVRVRPGMSVGPGDQLVTIADESAPPSVLALLPAGDRGELARGMQLRLELPGGAVHSIVDDVGRQVVGAAEARKLLGESGAKARLTGPVVVVRARLIGIDGIDGLRDGMFGTGEIDVGTRRLISTLLPGDD